MTALVLLALAAGIVLGVIVGVGAALVLLAATIFSAICGLCEAADAGAAE